MENAKTNAGKQKSIVSFLTAIRQRIRDFFKPEEIEITFKEDAGGNIISYTYTKVHEKHVA